MGNKAKLGAKLPKTANKTERLGSGRTWRRERPTRQTPPPTLPNVDVHGILFAIVLIVFVAYPLAQRALGL